MFRSVLTALALSCVAGAALAQSSPIPDARVPGLGGSDTRPGSTGGSPASSGSGIGSNVGAGGTGSPIVDQPRPTAEQAEAPETKPLIGLSRDLPPR